MRVRLARDTSAPLWCLWWLNPPHTLAQALQECLPVLVDLLGEHERARYVLEHAGG